MADEVVIIGGGFAGLAAAVALTKAGRRVRVLEQKPHLGGRAFSFRHPLTGDAVDNGQHLLISAYRATLDFLTEIGAQDRFHFQPRLALHFLDRPGCLTSFTCPNWPSPYHLLWGILWSAGLSWREKREVLSLGRIISSGPTILPTLTVEDWLVQQGQSESVRRRLWNLLCLAALNEQPRWAAADMFVEVLRQALFTSPKDSRFGYARLGLTEAYVDAAVAYLQSKGGRVERLTRVASILHRDGVCRGVRLSSGVEIEARMVISAVPWLDLPRVLGSAALVAEPFWARALNLRPVPIISISLWLDRPVTEVHFAGLRGTAIQWLFNKGLMFGVAKNYLSLVISGAYREMKLTKEALVALAARELGELWPAARDAQVTHSTVRKEPFATFSPCPGVNALRPSTRTPIKGFYLAGDWTDTGLPATIESAVRSGHAAASAVLQDS